jgi:nicotinic acid mononucleotide adenylyltransferase
MKWGLLGGTFDPIHFGHLRAAEEMLKIFDLNRIYINGGKRGFLVEIEPSVLKLIEADEIEVGI